MEDPTPIGARGFRHAAVLYRAADELAGQVSDFVAAGVRAGEAVLVVSSSPVLTWMRTVLDGHSERVSWADLGNIGTNPRRLTAALRSFAAEHRGQPVGLVQEAGVHYREPAQEHELIRHEALLNLAFSDQPVTALCGYAAQLPAGLLAGVARTHPGLVRDGHAQHSQAYLAGVTIPRECDQPLDNPPPRAATLTYRRDQAIVRSLVGRCAEAAGLSPDRATDLVIAVGELAANTLVHTSAPGTLAIWAADGEIFCQVHDSGEITDPLAGSLRPSPISPFGRRGLWVVHQLCDLVEVRSGPAGTTTRLRMRLPG